MRMMYLSMYYRYLRTWVTGLLVEIPLDLFY